MSRGRERAWVMIAGTSGLLSGCRLGFEWQDLPGAAAGGATIASDAGLNMTGATANRNGGGGNSGDGSTATAGRMASGGRAGSGLGGGTSGVSPVRPDSGVGAASSGGAAVVMPPDGATSDAAEACGNGVVDSSEECDTAVAAPADRCLASCRWDWYDRDFGFRRRILFSNAAAAASLTGFVVPIRLDSAVVDYSLLAPNGQDLLFVDDSHTVELAYEIEHWDAAGVSWVWIRVPELPATDLGSVWMYYGSPGAPARSPLAALWSAEYAAVFHFNGDADDSTTHNDGISNAVTTAAGQFAGGFDFAGAGGYVDIGSNASIDDLFASGATLSAWIHPRSYGGGDFGRILDKASDTFTTTGWGLQLDNGVNSPTRTLKFEHGFSTTFGGWDAEDDAIVLGSWSHVAVVFDGSASASVPALYINGARQTVTSVNSPAGTRTSDAALNLGIGEILVSKNRTFDGIIDEVRLERSLHDDNWVSASFRCAQPGFLRFQAQHAVQR